MLLLFLVGCDWTSGGAAHTRASIVLSEGWSSQPWSSTERPSHSVEMQTNIHLPDGIAHAGSELRMDGVWWAIDGNVNGNMLSATGGIAPVWLSVGPHLQEGQNELSFRLTAPEQATSTLLTGGSLTSSARAPTGAQISAAPTLIFQPEQHVSYAELQTAAEGVRPMAHTVDVPNGATVTFQAVLDGKILQRLGTATVQDGVALGELVDWGSASWALGDSALFWLTASLEIDGQQIDHWAGRVGSRAVFPVNGGLNIGNASTQLMGGRMVNEADMDSFSERLQMMTSAGLNAIEIHGEQLREDWLHAADELGLPVVVVPRCIGRAGRNRQGNVQKIQDLHLAQDLRMQRTLAAHPSAVLVVAEGPTGGYRLHSDQLIAGEPAEGQRLPFAGSEPKYPFDVPARLVQITEGISLDTLDVQCSPRRCENAWMVEMTLYWSRDRRQVMDTESQWQLCAEAFSRHLDQGSLGGIVPLPNLRDTLGWQDAWHSLSTQREIPQVSGNARGKSTVEISGLAPGEWVWIDVPHLHPFGAVANASGQATLSIWHKGRAQVRSGARSATVDLQPGAWENFSWVPNITKVTLPPTTSSP